MLKSSSEERIEMRVCETRRSASYRFVTAVSTAACSPDDISPLYQLVTAKRRSSEFCESCQQYTPQRAPKSPAALSCRVSGIRAKSLSQDCSPRDSWCHKP